MVLNKLSCENGVSAFAFNASNDMLLKPSPSQIMAAGCVCAAGAANYGAPCR